jgi:hypothetical protein
LAYRSTRACETDTKCEDEFGEAERIILEDLFVKRWIRRIHSSGKVYYFGLSQRTASILLGQIRGRQNADAEK